MKTFYQVLSFLAPIMLSFSCNEAKIDIGSSPQVSTLQTRATVFPKIVCNIDVSKTNPLNAGSYITSDGTPTIDMVILSTATIQGSFLKDAYIAYLSNNPDIRAIVNNPTKYIQPLHVKGIKVLYAIQGDHSGLGFANLTDVQIEDFSKKVIDQVNSAGLDGLFLRDEWADYGSYGYPDANTNSYGKLIIRLRELMPDKMITVFDIGYTSFTSEVLKCIDYGYFAYPSPFSFSYQDMGLPKSKWAPIYISLPYTSDRSASSLRSNSRKAMEQGYGAILLADMQGARDYTVLINAIVYGSKELTVAHNGEWFEKDW